MLNDGTSRCPRQARNGKEPCCQDEELELSEDVFDPDVEEEAPHGEGERDDQQAQTLRALEVEVVPVEAIVVLAHLEEEARAGCAHFHKIYF